MAKADDKAGSSSSPGSRTENPKPSNAGTGSTSAQPPNPAGAGAQWEDILQAAQAAEEAVAAAVQGMTTSGEQQIHPTEQAVYLAVHGAPQPEAK